MRKLVIFVLLFSIKTQLLADTFVVTTNADIGLGSLRAALTQAASNGTAVKDSILFNITDISETGRTILVLTQLPKLSSNIVIDGSSQPGLNFGVSGAKVKIKHSGNIAFFKCFIFPKVEKIEIYGIYFNDFKYWDNNNIQISSAIFIEGGAKNIKIGAPGKGNVFCENIFAITDNYGSSIPDTSEQFTDVEIKSNFFGLKEDGETMSNSRQPAIVLRSFKNLLIGGETDAEANYFIGGFNGGSSEVIYLNSYKDTGNGYVKLINNGFGTNFNKTIALRCGPVNIKGGHEFYTGKFYSDISLTILNNTYNNNFEGFSSSCSGFLTISNISNYISITGNKIGNLMGWLSCQTGGIGIFNCKNGIIGGDTPAEQNIIATNYFQGVYIKDCEHFIIQQNSFYCNAIGIIAESNKVTIPIVKMLSTNEVDMVAGKATPNCTIEIFENIKNCGVCNNGEKYLGKTVSGSDSTWSFTGAFSGAVTARATTKDSISGAFSEAKFDESKLVYEMPVCNGNNGFIRGMKFISGTKFYWIKYMNGLSDTIFNKIDLLNLEPALYEFNVEQTRYCVKKFIVNLFDQTPAINTQNQQINNPTCGLFNGSILNLYATGNYDKVYWLSAKRDTIGNNLALTTAGEGQYKLFVVNVAFGCADSTNWITLTNQSGPGININTAVIKLATCGNPTGSITGITATNITGTPFIQWTDSAENVIGNSFNLINIRAGKFRLRFKDQSSCDTIITPFFVVRDTTAIIINIANRKVVPAGCTFNNGSISNILVTNANTYAWVNMNGNIAAGNTLNISQLSSSFYQLTATNASGCSASSNGIFVSNAIFDSISVVDFTFRNAGCNNADGFIKINKFNKDAAKHSFRWIDSATNRQLSTDISIAALGKAVYILMAADSNGCERKIFSKFIDSLPTPELISNNLIVTNETCGNKQGSITGLSIKNLAGPTTYEWLDTNNIVKGNTINLKNLAAGKYKLNVSDANNCFIVTSFFEITNDINGGTKPPYNDVVVVENTPASLRVNNFVAGTYILYQDAAGTKELQRNTTGNFITAPITGNNILYVQHSTDKCISQLQSINITTVKSSYFTIAKAFTPNNDGVNNRLTVRITGSITINYFRIFNRFGQLIFETSKLNDSWDGTLNGVSQPVGAYIWIAEGKDATGTIIRDKGSIVLFR